MRPSKLPPPPALALLAGLLQVASAAAAPNVGSIKKFGVLGATSAALEAENLPPVQLEVRRPQWRLRGSPRVQHWPARVPAASAVTAGSASALLAKPKPPGHPLPSAAVAPLSAAPLPASRAAAGTSPKQFSLAEAVTRWEEAAVLAEATATEQVATYQLQEHLNRIAEENMAAKKESNAKGRSVVSGASPGAPWAKQKNTKVGDQRSPPPQPGQSSSWQAKRDKEESKRLHDENSRLREENGYLLREEVYLQAATRSLRRSDTVMRQEEAALLGEDTRLRGLVASLASSLAASRRSLADERLAANSPSLLGGAARRTRAQMAKPLEIGLFAVLGALVSFIGCFFTCASNDDDEDSDEYDSDEEAADRLKSLVNDKADRRRCQLCFCCNTQVMWFFTGVVVISTVGGAVLWELGILQPILGQCIMYIYITLIVSGFITLMVSQVWRMIRKMVNYTVTEFQKLRGVFHFFGKKSKYKWRDFLDDGQLNSSYAQPGGRPRSKR